MKEANQAQLTFSEWIVVGLFCGLIFSCFSLTLFEPSLENPESSYGEQQGFIITIKGAVEYPGRYQVIFGTPLAEVLALAQPLPNARLPQDQVLEKSRTFTLRETSPKSR